jgi:hypothetical protein
MDLVRVVGGGGADDKLLSLWPAEHHCVSMGVDLDAIGNCATFADPYHTVLAFGIRTPHASLGVEAYSIGSNG